MIWEPHTKNQFRAKIRGIFEKLVQKFGAEKMLKLIPESDKALVQHISKMLERSKRKKKEKIQELSGKHDVAMETEESGKREGQSFAEFMEYENTDAVTASADTSPKSKVAAKKGEGRRIREEASGEVLNLLDSNKMVSQILQDNISDDDDDDGIAVVLPVKIDHTHSLYAL
jgi:ribosomal RNA-processing protein 12